MNYKKVNPKNKKVEEQLTLLENKKILAKKEEEALINAVNSMKVVLPPVKIPEVSEKIETPEVEITEKEEPVLSTVSNDKNNVKDKKKVVVKKSSEINNNSKSKNISLDEEIQRNWKKLGRDRNGNKINDGKEK